MLGDRWRLQRQACRVGELGVGVAHDPAVHAHERRLEVGTGPLLRQMQVVGESLQDRHPGTLTLSHGRRNSGRWW